MDELQEVSPQAVDYLRSIDLAFWTAPHFFGKLCGRNASNVVEIVNSRIVEERNLSIIIELLHALTVPRGAWGHGGIPPVSSLFAICQHISDVPDGSTIIPAQP